MIFGAIWAEEAWGRYWGWDPKETVSFIAWVVYAAYLHARSTAGWRDRKAAWINVVGFVAMVFNLFFINLVTTGSALLRRGGLTLSSAPGQHPAAEPGFRAQQRFSDPAETVPPEWTAPTPPHGLPLAQIAAEVAVQPITATDPADPPPYFDLSTVALLGQPKHAPSQGWRRWVYYARAQLINLGEGSKAINARA